MTLAQSLGSASGLYFLKKAMYSATSGSSFQVGSPGSLRKAAVTRPIDLSSRGGLQGQRDRGGREADDVQRLPADVVDLADGLGGEFRQ